MRSFPALFRVLLVLAVCILGQSVPRAIACQPDLVFSSETPEETRGEIVAMPVTVRADTGAAPANRLSRIRITGLTNATVEVGGAPLVGNEIPLAQQATAVTFTARKVTRGQPFIVNYVAADACREMTRFVGAGSGDASLGAPTSTPVPTVVPPPTPTVSPTVGPAPTTSPAAGSLAPGQLRLTATFNSIGLELPFTGDANASATATLTFKESASPTWRPGLPLWRTDDGTQRTFFGSALLLTPGTRYDVRVTLSDADGVVGPTTLTSTIVTRVDNIPSRDSLVPTLFVRADGDDTNAGTSRSAAWRTLDKAIRTAPSGAVVEVGPGYYLRPAPNRSLPLTMIAQYPAIDDAREPINASTRSVIEGGPVSSPAGSGGPNPAPWQQVTLTGPGRGGAPAGAPYRVWKWSNPGLAGTTHIGYAATRAGQPQRIAIWRTDAADLATPEGWAEKLFTNQSYNYGAYQIGQDLYLRLPPNAPASDPNQLFITAGSMYGLVLNGSDSRVSGFEIRMADHGIRLGSGNGSVVDHNLLIGNGMGVSFGGIKGPPPVYGTDHVVQYNRIVDANFWTADHATAPAIPWSFVKSAIKNMDGTAYGTKAIGSDSTSTGIGAGTAQRVVIRRNTIDGTFNGVTNLSSSGYDRHAGQDADIHDNLIRHIADDAIEPEEIVINLRAWNNRVEHASTLLSTGPVNVGPIYLFRNEAWRIGNAGAGRFNDGTPGLSGRIFKYSGTSAPTARVYVLHNTIWTDQTSPNAIDGGAQSAGTGPSPEAFYLRNNILRASKEAFEAPTAAGRWNEDYNSFSTSDPTRGLVFGTRFTTDVAAYRAASGQGSHTNLSGSFIAPPALVDPAAGDLRLPVGSPLVDAGVPVPNVSDRAGIDYSGSAPDLGAREQ
jgi:hypothetical protein